MPKAPDEGQVHEEPQDTPQKPVDEQAQETLQKPDHDPHQERLQDTVNNSETNSLRTWVIGAIGAVLGFILSQLITLYTFNETQNTTKLIESISLARDLYREFYFEQPIYRSLRQAIESCKPLYKSWGGSFSHDEINRYLGFFADLGYFYKMKILDTDIIGHLFAPYVIEAYENKEVKKYVELLRTNYSQPSAFENFYNLAIKLEGYSEFSQLTDLAKHMCTSQKGG